MVILPWRRWLKWKVRSLISPVALSVAFFIASMRALCSLALASSNLVHVDVEVVPEEISEHLRGAELEEELGHIGCGVRP